MGKETRNAVEVNGLTKIFGADVAVNQISFSVKSGEIFGFLGPNGAGKTTIIRMLTGLLAPDAGDVRLDGIDIQGDSIKERQKLELLIEIE